jgi:hypothetical protein
MASEGLHEPEALLDRDTIDRHRAFTSLVEELQAIDWYDQRVRATDDPDLAAVLAHNRDDEKEHAAMALEWIRRRDPAFDAELRRYLFTSDPITGLSPDEDGPNEDGSGDGGDPDGGAGGAGVTSGDGSLGIASLRGGE